MQQQQQQQQQPWKLTFSKHRSEHSEVFHSAIRTEKSLAVVVQRSYILEEPRHAWIESALFQSVEKHMMQNFVFLLLFVPRPMCISSNILRVAHIQKHYERVKKLG